MLGQEHPCPGYSDRPLTRLQSLAWASDEGGTPCRTEVRSLHLPSGVHVCQTGPRLSWESHGLRQVVSKSAEDHTERPRT